jgi:hypothetical protein
VLEKYRVEVEQEADAAASELEVGEELGAVDGSELVYRFDFHDDGGFDEHINSNLACSSAPL